MASLQSSKNGGVMKVQDEEKDMPEVSESECSEKEREHIAQERGGKIEDVENVEVHDRGFLDAPMKGSNGIVGDEEDKFRNRKGNIECEGEEKEEKEEKDVEGGGKDKDLKEGAHEQEEKRKEKKNKDKEVEEVEDEGKELKEKKEKKKGKKAKEKEEEEEKESKEPKEKKKKKDDDKDEKEKEKKKDGEKNGDEKEEEEKTDKEKKKDKKKDKKEPKKKVEKLMQKIEKIEAKMQKLVLKKEECLKMLSEAEAEQTTPPQEAQPGTPPHEGVVETENAKEKGPCERAAETLEERELKILADDVSSITISNTKHEVPTVEGCDAAIPTGTVSTAVDETVTILATNK